LSCSPDSGNWYPNPQRTIKTDRYIKQINSQNMTKEARTKTLQTLEHEILRYNKWLFRYGIAFTLFITVPVCTFAIIAKGIVLLILAAILVIINMALPFLGMKWIEVNHSRVVHEYDRN
jgi:hypothetical protein